MTLPRPNSFADFLAEEHAAGSQDQVFWNTLLGDLSDDPARLPADHPVPARAQPKGHITKRALSEALSQRIKEIAAQNETTVFAVLWAGLGHVLHQLTGKTDSLVAVSHANRPGPEYSNTVGCFTKALPYPLRTTPDSLDETLMQAKSRARAIMAHQDVAVEDLALPAGTGGPGYLSGFAQMALQYNDFDWTEGASLPGVTPIDFDPEATSVFEISLAWSWKDSVLECAALARADLFDPPTLDGFLDAYADALTVVMS